jgi:xanthine dehydrogenase accessory factor
MSHNFLDDRLALESLLDTDVPHIGLMGPRKRFERMRDEMADEGTALTDDQLARLSTPVGLDLGGGEPIQIAMSIVSEALAVHNDKSGGRLRDKEGPIHERASVAADQS